MNTNEDIARCHKSDLFKLSVLNIKKSIFNCLAEEYKPNWIAGIELWLTPMVYLGELFPVNSILIQKDIGMMVI